MWVELLLLEEVRDIALVLSCLGGHVSCVTTPNTTNNTHTHDPPPICAQLWLVE